MSQRHRFVSWALLLLAGSGALGRKAAAQVFTNTAAGYIVVTDPPEWQGDVLRGIRPAAAPPPPGATTRQVSGTAFHPSGIERVTVNGSPADFTVGSYGVVRWGTTIPVAESTRRVEMIAYPRRGDPIVRIQNPDGTVQHGVGHGQPLRLGLATLPQDARGALLAALRDDSVFVSVDTDPDLSVSAEGGNLLVLGRDGSVRHRIASPGTAVGTARLVDVLYREYGALELATLAPPPRTFGIELSFPRGSDFRLGEGIEFRASSAQAGYLTLVDLGTDGTLAILFPFSAGDAAMLAANRVMELPTAAARAQFAPNPPYTASPPTGLGLVRAFVTPRPLVLPDPASGPLTAGVLLRALRNATTGGEPWATAVLGYRILP